jgi:hypothetical protein
MTFTRKDFITLSSLAAAGLFLPYCGNSSLTYNVMDGAGLLIHPSDVDRIRQVFKNEPLFEKLRTKLAGKSPENGGGVTQDTRMGISVSSEVIDREAARDFLRNTVRFNDQLYDIVVVGDLIENMSFYYLMTGDTDAAALAKESLDTLMKFVKWDYFLEGGTQTIGFQRAPSSTKATVLGMQWLGDYLSEEDKKNYLTVMAEKGLEPCFWGIYGMRYKDRVKGWGFDTTSTYLEHRPGDKNLDFTNWPIILDGNNLKAVPANSLLQGALVYQQTFGDSDNTRRWLEQALYSYSTLDKVFKEDGSYDEGVAYSTYTAIQMAEMETVLKNMMGRTGTGLVNWQGYADYLIEMSLPTHETTTTIVNFGDNWRAGNSSIAFYVANQMQYPSSQWLGRERYINHDIRSVIWYNPAVEPTAPPQGPRTWKCDLDWVVMRSGFEVEDLVVGFRSGPPSNHEHADRNHFLMACFGEQLVADLTGVPYMRADPSWMMRTTAGHNAILINGKPHQYHDGSEGTNASQASAKILKSGNQDGILYASSDATAAYALVDANIAKVLRSLIVVPEMHTTLVLDHVAMKPGNKATVEARFFAYNTDGNGKIETNPAGFRITRPMAYVDAQFMASDALKTDQSVLPIAPERQKDYPFGYALVAEAESSWLITALNAGKVDMVAATTVLEMGSDGSLQVKLNRDGKQVIVQLQPESTDPTTFTISRA